MKKLLCVVLMCWPGFSQIVDTAIPRVVERPRGSVMTDRAAARLLDQATWGPTPASIASLKNMGVRIWLQNQFTAPFSDLPDQPLLTAAGKTNTNLAPVLAAFFQNTVNGRDQLRQRVAFMLSQMWVAAVSPAYAYPPYWRIFRDHAFGKYREIIRAATLSPVMGEYLNMANNNKANASKGTAANENYGRELMQLFTLGLTQLNPDGTPVLDANKNPIPTYTQAQVTDMAKALTGWTFPTAPGATPKTNNPAYFLGPMFAVQSQHDTTKKTIFGNNVVPAGQTAEQDLETVIGYLMKQPTMAPFVSKQFIQHLVTSNPSPEYVQRVSEVFTYSDGDMQAVITAILTDPEARAGDHPNAAANPTFGHLREPLLFLTGLARGLNGTLTPTNTLNSFSTQMGQNLFNPPSVFSYFSPLYRTQGGLLGPEFQIYSTQTAAYRANVISTALYGTLDSTTKLDLSPFVALAGNTTDMLNYMGYVFLHSGMSQALGQAAASAANAQATPTAKAQAALYVVLTSSEYQVVQ
jgi:uncharacterized protein (DUF1800 family)